MNAVRSLFAAATVAAASVPSIAYGSQAAAAVSVCCTGSGGGPACPGGGGGNRTAFDAIETFGGRQCDDDAVADAAAVRKCCKPDRAYDPDERTCRRPADPDADAAAGFRSRLRTLRGLQNATAVGYRYGPPKCDGGSALVDVPVDEVVGGDGATPAHCLDVRWTRPSSTDERPEQLTARECRPREQYCGGSYACANKCCMVGKMLVEGLCKKNDETPFRPPVHEVDGHGALVPVDRAPLPFFDRLNCTYGRDRLDAGGFALLSDGSLYRADAGARLTAAEYCLEYSTVDGGQAVLEAYVCAAAGYAMTAEDSAGSWKYVVIAAGIVPSIVCLIVTLIVYVALSSLRNVHGYYVMCYVACLLLSFVCMLVVQWASDAMGAVLCELFGYIMLFALLTTFCWLNVICFDIYWMLRYNNSINKSTSVSLRTVMYNIYCWGFSSICTITGFLFQHSEKPVLREFAPNIGTVNSCWFATNDYGTLIFFLLPVSAMLIANLILFVLTAVHCSRIKSELSKFKRSDTKTKRFQVEKEKFSMSIKLFLVMGIPWSFEILSKIFQNGWFIWIVLDEINALQGVMIFIIFVAKRKVITSLRKRFNSTLDNSESTKMNTISGSSQNGSARKSFNDF